jgi:hypothetical protein
MEDTTGETFLLLTIIIGRYHTPRFQYIHSYTNWIGVT